MSADYEGSADGTVREPVAQMRAGQQLRDIPESRRAARGSTNESWPHGHDNDHRPTSAKIPPFQLALLLLVLIVLIAACLGWVVHRARAQRDAVAAILKLQGTVKYDWERKDARNLPNGKPWWPGWLVNLFGIDYFAHVTQVRLVAVHELTDTELIHISNLSGLEELDLHRSPVTDARLGYLEGLTDLQSLTLFHTPITDTGLAHLKGMHRLRMLSIENTNVTDSGARELQKALPSVTIKR